MQLQNPVTTVDLVQIAPQGILQAAGSVSLCGDVENQGLIATGDGSLRIDGQVTGSGNTSGHVIFSGGYSPGNSPAVVMHENVTFTEQNGLTMEIAGTIPGQFDQLQISATATLGGLLEILLIDNFVPQVGDTFALFQWSSHPLGTFSTITTPPAFGWDTSRLYTEGIVQVTSVPEPAAWMLVAAALLGIVRVNSGEWSVARRE